MLIDKTYFGAYLCDVGLLTIEQRDEILEIQKNWGSRIGDIAISRGWINSLQLSKALADFMGFEFINLMNSEIDNSLFENDKIELYNEYLFIPWNKIDNTINIAIADPNQNTIEKIKLIYSDYTINIVCTAKFDIVWSIQKLGREFLKNSAVNDLSLRSPIFSAKQVLSKSQKKFFVLFCFSIFLLCLLNIDMVLIGLNAFVSMFLFMIFVLKIILAYKGSSNEVNVKVSEDEVSQLRDIDLPIYTILVPMYKEPDVLPILTNALRKLDYPISKLDVKIVLEENDEITINAAKNENLESFFEIIIVPDSQPKTKPKACNYALKFARGEFVTIYDAEDKPDPDQLKKVIAAFRKSEENIICMQCRLNYFNADENWLTRMFTLEYTSWFDFYLPGLEYFNIPIPLGGTSNHFKLNLLRKLHAWDPFNVTEDADLGVRITQNHLQVGMVNSTTYEEANVSIPNWIRQRSRWLKGYMQTYLVHMRDPMHLYSSTGHKGFWGFQFFVGGNFFTALIAPILWGIFILWFCFGGDEFSKFFPQYILYFSLANLLLGNGLLIYLNLLAGLRRKYYRLIPFALTAPLYWVLQSISAYKGLWQLIVNPFYWEKTVHGLSKQTMQERENALKNTQ